MITTSKLLGATLALCLVSGTAVRAEDAPPPAGQRQRGNFDPEQFRAQMLERTKTSLGATDEEWKALGPKVEAAQKASMAARFSRFGRRGGPGGGDAANAAPKSELEKAQSELQALTENKEADPKAVKEKLTAFRAAKEKSKADLKKTQDELRELLTPRQEAVLVLQGILE